MEELSYFLEPCADLMLALAEIAERIPCLVDWRPLDEDDPHIVVTITCRQEDAAFVERMLAPFV